MTDHILKLIEEGKYVLARQEIIKMNAADIAQLLEALPQDKMLKVFRMLPKDTGAEVFAFMDHDEQQYIVESITDFEINNIMDELFMDDTVDFIEEMPANVVKKVLKNTDETTRKIINQILQYPDDSAGSIMTIEFVDLKKEMTVSEALTHIRQTGIDKETINNCYVIDSARKLEGTVSIRRLILSDSDTIVADIMDPHVISVHTMDDQETAIPLFKKYDLISLPVVDNENRLVGIITIDDVLDVIEEENTEDFHKMAAMAPSEETYLKTGVFKLARNRIFWLLILMLSATMTSFVIRKFEALLASMVVLSSYIPMLMSSGGNSGAQSSTVIIRSLALGEVRPRDALRVLWKELRVGILAGSVLAIVNCARVLLFDHVAIPVALVISLTLFLVVIIAKLIGCMLPLGAKVLHLDPTIMASPIISTVVDTITLIVYFTIASTLLGL